MVPRARCCQLPPLRAGDPPPARRRRGGRL